MTGCALTYLARPASNTSNFLLHLRTFPPRFRFRLARPASRWSVSARPVRGVLELVAQTRKPHFREIQSFYDRGCFCLLERHSEPVLGADLPIFCPFSGMFCTERSNQRLESPLCPIVSGQNSNRIRLIPLSKPHIE